jgi:hypothetical protein
MARRRVADGGDGLQICKVAANILTKQSMTANKGWSSSLWVGEGLTTAHRQTPAFYEMSHRASELDGSSDRPRQRCGLDASGSRQGPVVGSCERGNEPSGSIKGGEILDQLSDC